MKESPWFGSEDKPVRKGIYKVEYPHSPVDMHGWAYFDGKRWGWTSHNYYEIEKKGVSEYFIGRYWKGIVK